MEIPGGGNAPTGPARPPQIVLPTSGAHNADLERSAKRWSKGNAYRDNSTIMVVPAIKPIPPKVVSSWMNLMRPMNARFVGPLFIENMEVGDAYEAALNFILSHSDFQNYSWMFTVETDNILQPDTLIKLIEDAHAGAWTAVGAIYWTKGEGGAPMAYGRPHEMPKNYRPFVPPADAVTQCNGLGMGATLFRLSALKNAPRPLFKTVQDYAPGRGARAFTQDLYAFEQLAGVGGRFAVSTRTQVGHYDWETDFVW